MPGVCRPAGIHQAAAGQMPTRGQQALLLKLPHPLLQAGNAPTDARRDAVCGTADAADPPRAGVAPYGGNHAKKKEKHPCRINSFCACWVRTNDISTAPWRGCSQALCAASALRPTCAMGFICSLPMQGRPSTCFLSLWERYARRCAFLPPPAPRRCGTGWGVA